MRVSILIATYERQDLLRRCLDALEASGPPAGTEVLAHCQGRDDGSAGLAEHRGCKVLTSPEPVAFAKSMNVLAGETSPESDWLLLLNNDVFLRPGFWEALAEMAALGYEVAGAKLLYPDDRIQHFGKWFTLDCYPFHVLRFQPAGHEQAQQVRPCPDVTFACVAVRHTVWQGLGGLDEGYANGFEDDDFCLRAREAGAQIGVHFGMLATHLESQTTGADNSNKEAQWVRFREQWVESGRISWPLGLHLGWRQ